MYYVYIIRCIDSSLYTGITTDVERRFAEHVAGTGAAYTRSHKPLAVVYTEHAENRGAAQKREAEIKKLSHTHKLYLCGKLND